jgi:hypothetical protein
VPAGAREDTVGNRSLEFKEGARLGFPTVDQKHQHIYMGTGTLRVQEVGVGWGDGTNSCVEECEHFLLRGRQGISHEAGKSLK